MPLSAAMMKALFDAGATPEMVVRAAAAEEQRVRDAADHKRELARLRKQKQRAKSPHVTPVTRDIGDTRDIPSPEVSPRTPFPNPNPSIPPSPPKGGSSPTTKPAIERQKIETELRRVLPDDLSEALIEHRKALKSPLTARAAKALAQQLEGWGDASEAANAMLANGWKGFNPEWMRNRSSSSRDPPTSPRSGHYPSSSRTSHEGHHRRHSGDFADEQREVDRKFARLGAGSTDREGF